MIAKILKSDRRNIDHIIYGESDDYIICGISETPAFSFEEITEHYSDFKQTCCPNVWEKTKPTIAELIEVMEKVEAIGPAGHQAQNMRELNLMYENIMLHEEVDTLALTILELMEV